MMTGANWLSGENSVTNRHLGSAVGLDLYDARLMVRVIDNPGDQNAEQDNTGSCGFSFGDWAEGRLG